MKADNRGFRTSVFEQFARITSALSSPRRLEMVDLLAQSERSVEELARMAGLSLANASRHLKVLKAARLVDVRREGPYAYYRLADEHVFRAWRAIRDLADARLTELAHVLRSFGADRAGAEPLTAVELLERLHAGDAVVIDVRPEEEYRVMHVAGARSLPLSRLEAALKELPADKEVIAYCRGPYCLLSDQAVALLMTHGFRARRLELGLPDWNDEGLPVASGAET